jgi:hypothetical protein
MKALVAAGAVLSIAVSGCASARGHRLSATPAEVQAAKPNDLDVVERGSVAGFIGSNWRLIRVHDRSSTTSIPSAVPASVALYRDGEYTAYDGVNGSSGRYRATATGFRAVGVRTTLIGYKGSDHAVIDAMGAIGEVGAGGDVRSYVLGDQMTLDAGKYRLDFRRGQPLSRKPHTR